MKLIHKNSLADTVDAVNEALFFGKKISEREKKNTAKWLASRQGVKGSYWGMIAPTGRDFETGIRTFTGERITTGAGTSHILGEESSRAIIALGVNDKAVLDAVSESNKGFERAMKNWLSAGKDEGKYCCGPCSASYWRHLAAGGLKNQKKRLDMGMKYLSKMRDGKGKWKKMPYYYTLLALSEINTPLAKKELKYTAPVLEKIIHRKPSANKYQKRHIALAEKILAMI